MCLCVTEIITVLRIHGPTSSAVCENAAAALCSLGTNADSRVRLTVAGICEGVLRARLVPHDVALHS